MTSATETCGWPYGDRNLDQLAERAREALREGDVIFFRCNSFCSDPSKTLIAIADGLFCGGPGFTHVGIMLKLSAEGPLWLVHSSSIMPGVYHLPRKDGGTLVRGIHASDAGGEIMCDIWTHNNVIRPTPDITQPELRAMRERANELMDLPYEQNVWAFLNGGINCSCLFKGCSTDGSFFCSELAADLLMAGGRLAGAKAQKVSRVAGKAGAASMGEAWYQGELWANIQGTHLGALGGKPCCKVPSGADVQDLPGFSFSTCLN